MERKPVLDYSSPAEEHRRERSAKDARREAIENYNESTYGERRPIASAFLRIAVFALVVAVVVFLLPRRAAGVVLFLLLIAFWIWDARKGGPTSGGWALLRHPWRRW